MVYVFNEEVIIMRKCPICKKDEKNIIKKMKFCIPKEYRISSEYNIVSCKHQQIMIIIIKTLIIMLIVIKIIKALVREIRISLKQ